MTTFDAGLRPIALRARLATLVLSAIIFVACASRPAETLGRLCADGVGSARVTATVDTVRGPGGPALAGLRGTRFELRFAFTRAAAGASAGEAACSGTVGTATFAGDLPERLRTATSSASTASWHIEGDTVLLDLNPGTRDNNLFVVLPLRGGRGHWGLSTFAGEVAGGATESGPR